MPEIDADAANLEFSSLFDIDELQRLQDAFALATGVASLITKPDGTPITKPSNFCRLCIDVIRKTELGRKNCYVSDAALGKPDLSGPTVQPCLSGGLWDAGASITVGGRHIANWLIGQVLNDRRDEEKMLRYADTIGADREQFRQALAEVTVMSVEQFQKVADALFLMANQLSGQAYQNYRQKLVIRENRQITQSLRASERDFRELAQRAPIPIAICRADATIEFVNARFTQTFGYTLDDLPDLDAWWRLAYPDEAYRQKVMRNWRVRVETATHSGQAIPAQLFNVTCKDGLMRVVEISGAGIGDKTLVLFTDMTAHELAQQRLKLSEDKFRTIFDSINEFVFVHDADTGAILDVNLRACQAFGYTKEEMLRLDVGELSAKAPPYDQQHAVELMRRVVGGSPQLFEWRSRRKNGELFWVEGGMRLARIGHDDRLLVSVRDITDRKNAQDAILREKAFTDAVMNSVPGLLYLYDDQGRLVRWNNKHEELTGYTSEELSQMTLADWYKGDPEEYAKIQKAVERVGIDGFASAEGNLRNKDGSRRLYYLTGVPLELEGRQYFTGIGIDITERKRMQEMMVQTEKMMSVAGLAAGMAHEINNPLSAILQSAQVLERRLCAQSQANEQAAAACGCDMQAIRGYLERREISAMLQGIRESGSRAARIVANMLEFSRTNESVRAPADLNLLLDKTVELCVNDYDLKKKYDFRAITIVREYDQGLPAVRCTATQIEQVFMNLLKNAAQAMSAKRQAGKPARIVLRTRAASDVAVVEVEDNGPGMAESVRKRVFEPFFTTKPPGEGTGLGLSVSYFIVTESHKGTVEVLSTPGQGTLFRVCLPFQASGGL